MKKVYMIGAGASNASQNTPIGKDLVWGYGNQYTDYGDDDNDLKSFREFLDIADKYFNLNERKLFEDSIIKKEDKKFYEAAPERLNRKEYFIDEFLRHLIKKKDLHAVKLIKRLILEHISGTPPMGNKLYSKLVKQGESDTAFITTNFDTWLATSERSMKPEMMFDCLMDFDVITEDANDYYRAGGIPLIKLNGSIDWGVCLDCHKWTLLTPHVSARSFEESHCFCGGLLEPRLVHPYGEHDNKLNHLFKKASEFISGAECLTIIGYSFPEYDQRVIELFRLKMQDSLKIEVVDLRSNDESEQDFKKRMIRIRQMFNNQPCNFWSTSDGFEKYINNEAVFKAY